MSVRSTAVAGGSTASPNWLGNWGDDAVGQHVGHVEDLQVDLS
jgi:hypothetical protein